MSNSIGDTLDIMSRYQAMTTAANNPVDLARSGRRENNTPSNELSFTDMLQLMVLQFQNQTMDNTADTSDMMNQLVQMSVVQAMTSMSTQMEELTQANILSYSASLVGKEVTVGVRDKDGALQELVGTVTATGTYNGSPVIFMGDKSYLLSDIMAVGRLPKLPETETPPTDGDKTSEKTEGSEEIAALNRALAGPDWNGVPTVG